MDEESVQNRQGQLYLLGARGYSAYEVAVLNGYVGTEEEWLESLKGEEGEPGTPFGDLTPEQIEELRGPQGKSAYQISVDNGFVGTEQQWVNSFLTPDGYYTKAEVDNKLNKKPYYFTNVNAMKQSTLLKEGDLVFTKGYHRSGDGGGAQYYISSIMSLTEYQEQLDSGLYAILIVNDVFNVKQLGAYGDGTHEDTTALNTALGFINYFPIYFPEGKYITANLTRYRDVTNDVKILGDNAYIKLKDNCVTADFKQLFSFRGTANVKATIYISGLYIDMNRTNNHSVIDDSGDTYALQHCHAIAVYPDTDGTGKLSVKIDNVNFYDLIADGLSISSNGTGYFDLISVTNIKSSLRAGTRSDICLTCDFQTLLCSNNDLECLEIELNALNANILQKKMRFGYYRFNNRCY